MQISIAITITMIIGNRRENTQRYHFRSIVERADLRDAQPAARSTSEGVFTEEQAQRGAMAYNKNCAGCHGSALRSTDREVPNLTGEFIQALGRRNAW